MQFERAHRSLLIWTSAIRGMLPIGDIDLLGEVTGLGGYSEVKAMAIDVDAYGWVCLHSESPGADSGEARGRPKDLLVLPELESLLEAEEP